MLAFAAVNYEGVLVLGEWLGKVSSGRGFASECNSLGNKFLAELRKLIWRKDTFRFGKPFF